MTIDQAAAQPANRSVMWGKLLGGHIDLCVIPSDCGSPGERQQHASVFVSVSAARMCAVRRPHWVIH